MEPTRSLEQLTDGEILLRLADILRQSRRNEADLVAHIAEADTRRLYAREASPSMFAYCTERLHLSEAEAYLRIAAARASRQHPILLAMLADGRLHLTAIAKLAPHLTPDNRDAVLRAGHPLLEAPGRRARGRVGTPSRCAGSHPEAARALAHRSFPDERATSP